ncbi:MAG: DUF5615 family PIN-like protein [Halorientalis sp.]
MAVRFLLDENIEQQVLHRLEKYGYDVEHVEFVTELGKGATDTDIAQYSLANAAVIATQDDDFVTDHDDSDFFGVVYFEDATLTATEIADILHRMADSYPHSAFEGIEFGGRAWL